MPGIVAKAHKNLAASAKAEASTEKSAERRAANVIDGSPSTRWTSLYEDGQWLLLDLGDVYTIAEVRIRWEMACAESYLVQGSSDGSSFTTFAQEVGHEGWVVSMLAMGCQARWVRMFGQTRATAFGFSIWEMQVMGSAIEGSTPSMPAGMKAAPKMPGATPSLPSAPKAASKAASWNGALWYDVVHDRVAVRGGPSTKAQMVSAAKKGEGFRGVKLVIEGVPWLRLDEGWVEEFRPDITKPKGVEGLWVLIDGKSVGLGELLRQGVEPPETAGKAKGAAKAAAAPVAAAVVPAKPQSVPAAKAPTPQPFMSESEWVVAYEKVDERVEPNVNATSKRVRKEGELVKGTPCYVGNNPWLQLKDGGWIIMDGRYAAIPGKLLVPAADIASDVMHWAEQHKNSEACKHVAWNEETEAELRRMDMVVGKQVEQLRPLVGFPHVVKRLEEDGFIGKDEFTLGPDGIVKSVRRKLIRARAGVKILGEEVKDNDRLPWTEEEFAVYLGKVIPTAPFFCRSFAPEDPPSRVLILLHGSLVGGDDLVAEAETLRRMMPETAVVLPEGPVIANELGLRVWWAPPVEAPEEVRDIREVGDIRAAKRYGLLNAPDSSVSRVLATVRWVASRFKSVPYILGGFSQGSMLVAQSIDALRKESLVPSGVLILSGLVSPFSMPNKMAVMAVHGDQDDKIGIDMAREVAGLETMKMLKLEEVKGMGHEISDAVVDKIVRFCDQAVPVVRAVARQEESEWVQEANQAKLLRWVKKVSQVITMFDDARFMSHIVHLNMAGLGSESPGLGSGPLFRYCLHSAGPESRGTVILFHGKIYDLQRETRKLVEAYRRLNLSVALIDYRQKFSQFCVDATVVLESVAEITGSETSPIVIHAIGCGAIAGLHMAIASHAYPSNVKRRMRLLVLDGAVGNFRSLPPSPTGCIATDPIGNDEKLKYIGLPLALIGGDDACCGLKWSSGHWTVLGRMAESLQEEGKIPALTMNTGTALMSSLTEARLCPDLYRACEEALDNVKRSGEAAQKFAEDVLGSADIADQAEYRKFKDEDLKKMLLKLLSEVEASENQLRLWYIRAEREPKRSEELRKFMAELHMPHLEAHGGFPEGMQGFQQFQGACSALGELNQDLKKANGMVRDAFSVKKLDEAAAELLADRGRSLGISIDQCHGILDSAISEWRSHNLIYELADQVRERGGTSAVARQVVKEHSAAMNVKRGQQLGFEGSDDEVNVKLGKVFGLYQKIDPTLGVKMHEIQEGVMRTATQLHDMFKNAPAVKAPTTFPQKKEREVVQDVQVTIEHAMDGGTLHLLVKSNATMMEIRRTIMGELGEMKLSQVKLVSKMGHDAGFQGLPDDSKLGERRHLFMMGRPLRSEAAAATEVEAEVEPVELLVYLDRNMGLVSMVQVPPTATIADVKVELAKEDGSVDPAACCLKLPDTPDSAALDDSHTVEGLEELDYFPLSQGEAASGADSGPDLQILVHIDVALGLQTEMTLRPGSKIRAVKEQLAEADPTGATKPEDFGLRLPGAAEGALLEDGLAISAEIRELEVCLPF